MQYLFYGTLRDPEVLSLVAGPGILTKQAGEMLLHGFGCYYVEGEAFPALLPMATENTPTCVYRDLSQDELAAITDFEGDHYRLVVIELIKGEKHSYFDYIDSSRISGLKWSFDEFLQLHRDSFLTKVRQWIRNGNWIDTSP